MFPVARMVLLIWTLSLFFFLGCAQQRPVLYPNPYLKTVGQERAEADINECIRLASEHGAQGDAGEQVGKDTAKGGAVGGAGRGATAGAAGGAAGALTRGLFHSSEPDLPCSGGLWAGASVKRAMSPLAGVDRHELPISLLLV